MLAAVGFGIHIKHRRQPPPFLRQQKTVITQMIVSIPDEMREHHSTPKFVQVGFRCCTMLREPFGNFEITMITFSVNRPQHRHSRSVMNPPHSVSIKALREKRRPCLGELLTLRLGNVQPHLARQNTRLVLKPSDISLVLDGRKLGDPKAPIRRRDIRLRSRPRTVSIRTVPIGRSCRYSSSFLIMRHLAGHAPMHRSQQQPQCHPETPDYR